MPVSDIYRELLQEDIKLTFNAPVEMSANAR